MTYRANRAKQIKKYIANHAKQIKKYIANYTKQLKKYIANRFIISHFTTGQYHYY